MIPFSKYAGCGNDFILIDHLTPSITPTPSLIQKMCNRKGGIGADGVIFLEPSNKADWKMRIFNADGSEAEMCGNGIRCLGRFINDLNHKGSNFSIETMERILQISLLENSVSVEMGEVADALWDLPLSIDQKNYSVDFLNTGVPHAVILVDDIEKVDIQNLGPKIRYHPQFSPKGSNATFVSFDGKTASVRTYERGVEGETLACGTGVTAAAVSLFKRFGLKNSLSLLTRSGDYLTVQMGPPLKLTGGADFLFRGQFPLI